MYGNCAAPHTMEENWDDIFEKMDKHAELKLEPRDTFLKLGVISTAKGSAYIEYGNTKVLACVESPREFNKQTKRNGNLGVVICSFKFAPFATRNVASIPRQEAFMSIALKKTFEPVICRNEFPNFEIQIRVMVLDDDGCVLSTSINCVGAALAAGGIPTYDLITASTSCIYKQYEFLNPNAAIEQLLSTTCNQCDEEHGIVVTASLSAVGQLSECFQKGYLTPETLEKLSDHTLVINDGILSILEQVLVTKIKKHLCTKENDKM